MNFSYGDIVQIADREPTGSDTKSGLFFPHYRGLVGSVSKVYPDGTAAVTVDPVALPEALRKRHDAGSDAQRRKWLDSLSDEARNRLTSAEKQFAWRYTILVSTNDLMKQDRKRSQDLDTAEEAYLQARQRKD